MVQIDKAMLAALSATKVEDSKEGLHSILYGEPKSGKTSTLDDPNLKVLLLDLEGGTSVLAGSPNVDRVTVSNLEQLNVYMELLNENKWIKDGKLLPIEHGLIAIDGITRMCDYVKEYVVKTVAPRRKREVEGVFGAQSDWGNYGTIIADTVKYAHTLTKRGNKSLNIMWLAHKDNKYENPMAETQITGTQIKMQGSSVPIVMSVVDAIFYMAKGNITNPRTKETNMYYWIQTDTVGVTEAGVRQAKREEKLPTKMYNPVWSDIFRQLGYSTEPPKA
jgi:hypothetical protein